MKTKGHVPATSPNAQKISPAPDSPTSIILSDFANHYVPEIDVWLSGSPNNIDEKGKTVWCGDYEFEPVLDEDGKTKLDESGEEMWRTVEQIAVKLSPLTMRGMI